MLILIGVLGLMLPISASAADPPYDHVWRIEGLYVGDAGATRRAVRVDDMSLSFTDGRWSGTVRLEDTLGIQESSGVTQSQDASITLELDGSPAEGGTSAAGRFVGVAELRVREASSLEQALARSTAGAVALYDVSGFWAARLEKDVARGQLVFQSARRRAGSTGPDRDAEWFNRASEEGFDATGQPQPFTVAVVGIDPSSGATGDDRPASGSTAPKGPGFFEYLRRGVAGTGTQRPLTVSQAQARAGRMLKESRPSRARDLPDGSLAVDVDVAGGYLDSKNRAAGLLDSGMVPTGATFDAARVEAKALYESVPGRPAPGATEDATTFYKDRVAGLLGTAGDLTGADVVLGELADVPAGADAETVTRLRRLLAAVESVAAPFPSRGEVSRSSQRSAELVASSPIRRSGPLAASVLAAADDPTAPAGARTVTRFRRAASLDTSGTPAGEGLPNRVLAVAGTGGPPAALVWSGGAGSAQPDAWVGYVRADETAFWLAGDGGPVALRDASLNGWAWRLPRAALVDALRVGRVYETYQLP